MDDDRNAKNTGAGAASAPPSSSDAWRFDYRLTGWAREAHEASIYCVAFFPSGKEREEKHRGGGGDAGEKEEEGDEEEEEENEFPLERVFASVGSRRITVYLAPSLRAAEAADESAAKEQEREGGQEGEGGAEEEERRRLSLLQRRLPFSVLQTYLDAAADEEFYVCRWALRPAEKKRRGSSSSSSSKKKSKSKSKKGKKGEKRNPTPALPLLLAGGKRGVLRVIDPKLGGLSWTARGHGGSINDIAVHPSRPGLALTASRDQSVRLWNLESRCCVAQFAGGDGAHVAEVLSVDWHPLDPFVFASSGYDSSVKVWSLEGVKEAVEASFGHRRKRGSEGGEEEEEEQEEEELDDDNDAADDGKELERDSDSAPFAPRVVPSPRFSSQRVHSRVADCVRWLGPGVLLSKTVDDRVLAWSVAGIEGLACPLEGVEEVEGGGRNPSLSAAGDERIGNAAKATTTTTITTMATTANPPPPPSTTLVPRLERPRVRLLNSMRLSNAENVWFLRFALDAKGETLACGGKKGTVTVFDPRKVPLPGGGPAEPRKKLRCAVPRGVKSFVEEQQEQQGISGGGTGTGIGWAPPLLSVPAPEDLGGESAVRQTALSDDGSTLLASCDDGTIWRFDRPERES